MNRGLPTMTPEQRTVALARAREARARQRELGAPAGFDPLRTCPSTLREKLSGRASRAHRSQRDALVLMCVSCTGWSHAEAARCEIRSCPLWAFNRRYLSRDGEGSPDAATEGGDGLPERAPQKEETS